MIPTTKQKWVIDRLKRQGWKTNTHFMSYSPEQCLLWFPKDQYDSSFDWDGFPFFYMDNRKGLWMHFRPLQNPALHLDYHIPWLTVKNWDSLIKPFLKTCEMLNKNRDLMNFDTFSQRESMYGTDVAVSGLHLVT
jgi:hypothetical protein